jgi:hypothetical protein
MSFFSFCPRVICPGCPLIIPEKEDNGGWNDDKSDDRARRGPIALDLESKEMHHLIIIMSRSARQMLFSSTSLM